MVYYISHKTTIKFKTNQNLLKLILIKLVVPFPSKNYQFQYLVNEFIA